MTADPWSAFLTARRRVHQAVVERVELRGWTSGDDAWNECGPMGIAEMSAACASREALRLLEFASAMADFADHCHSSSDTARTEGDRSRSMDYAFVAQTIREALTKLATTPEETPTDDAPR